MFRRLALAALLACLWAGSAAARPYGVDDLLRTEDLGRAAADPAGRWIAFERQRPWAQAATYAYGTHTRLLLREILLVEPAARAPLRRAFPHQPDEGYTLGPVAPDGRHLVVYRLSAAGYELGVLNLARRQVWWTGLTPEQAIYGRVAQWRSADELVVIARPDGSLPRQLRRGPGFRQQLAETWAAADSGRTVTGTPLGSGRYLAETLPTPDTQIARIAIGRRAIAWWVRGRFVDMELSPGGAHLALVDQVAARQPRAGEPVFSAFPVWRRTVRLVDLATGAASSPCPACDIDLRLLAWSPSGRALLVAHRAADRTPQLIALAPDAPAEAIAHPGIVLAAATNAEGAPLIAAGWLGETPVLRAQASGATEPRWYLAGASPKPLTPDLASPAQMTPDLAGGLIFESGERVWRLDADQRLRPLSRAKAGLAAPGDAGPGSRFQVNPGPVARVWLRGRDRVADTERTSAFMIAPADEILALTPTHALLARRQPSGAREVILLDRHGQARTLETLNRHLAEVSAASPQAIAHVGRDGQPTTSWLYLPPGAPGTSLPRLVIIPYPGATFPTPSPGFSPGRTTFHTQVQILAGAGFAVLTPSLAAGAPGEPAAGLAQAILAAADAVAATGLADARRPVLFGQSFGGYAVLVAAAQSSRFGAVVATSPLVDLTSAWGGAAQHYRLSPGEGGAIAGMAGLIEAGQTQMGAPPWDNPERYRRNSPLFLADRITAPVMLVAGDQDDLPQTQALALFAALHRQGKDATLTTYWGEGHVVLGPANVTDLYDRIIAFIRQAP